MDPADLEDLQIAQNRGGTTMSVRRRTAAAIAIAVAATAAVVVPAMAQATTHGAATKAVGATAGAPAAAGAALGTTVDTATVADTTTTTTAATFLNAAGARGLTISNGTRWVVIDGRRVDFGTAVHDLAWNPAGTKAAFVDGHGNLDVANADGRGRVVVAKNPGGQTWSHPTWQVAKADPRDQLRAKDNLIFVASKKGVTRLETVVATAHDAKPSVLTLFSYSGNGVAPLPTTGNDWPNAGGTFGTIVYANDRTNEVYIRDDNIRQQGGAVLQGSEPALSPDGEEIVFVRSVHGHDHIFEAKLNTMKPLVRDLTPHATVDETEPTFSPDGRSIAFRTPTGIDVVPATGQSAPVRVSGYVGLPAYRG